MSQQISTGGASLAVDRVETGFAPTESDFEIPRDDLLQFSATSKAGNSVDEGEVVIDNSGYQYTTGADQVGIGDRVEFFVQTETEQSSRFGHGPFGYGPFGGARRVGTYRVTGRDIVDHPGEACDLTLSLADWVFSTLAIRKVWHGKVNKPICGSEDAHVNAILDKANIGSDLINRSALPTISETADYFVRGRSARKAIDELASIAASKQGPVVQRSYGTRLVFEPLANIEPVQPDPLPDSAFGPLSTSETDKGLVNSIRISGGIDDNNQIDDSQTTVDHYTAPTDSTRLTTQISVRKSELSTIELWTESTTSDEGIRVRLQSGNADDTAPIAPADTSSDLVTGDVLEEDLTAGGWAAWDMPEHTLNAPNPWLIVDSPGSNTTGVGVDANEVPAFRAYFPRSVEAVIGDFRSQYQYGRYDGHRKRESLITEHAIADFAHAILGDSAWPDTTLGPVEAVSDDAHNLVVGDIVVFDRPGVGAEGEFIVTSRESSFQGVTLRTDLEFKRIDNYV